MFQDHLKWTWFMLCLMILMALVSLFMWHVHDTKAGEFNESRTSYKTTIDNYMESAKNREDQIKALILENSDLRNSIQAKEKKIAELDQKLKDGNPDLLAQIGELEKKITAWKIKCEGAEERLEMVKGEKIKVEDEVRDKVKAIQGLQDEIKLLNGKFDEATSSLEKLQKENTDLAKEANAANMEAGDLKNVKERLEDQVAKLLDDIDKLKKEAEKPVVNPGGNDNKTGLVDKIDDIKVPDNDKTVMRLDTTVTYPTLQNLQDMREMLKDPNFILTSCHISGTADAIIREKDTLKAESAYVYFFRENELIAVGVVDACQPKLGDWGVAVVKMLPGLVKSYPMAGDKARTFRK